MSTEVCPHCGKTFKRLKSHLPHCKAATSSKTPQAARDVTTSQTPAAALSKTSIEGRKTRQTCLQAEKDKMAPLPVSPSFSTASAEKKQKVADQTKSTTLFSSPPPPTVSKPKKKSLRALIEAAKLDQITKESQKKTEESSFSCGEQEETKIKILDSNVKENSTNPHARDGFRVETEESPAQKLLSKPGSGQAKVTLQDVKSTLGRVNGHRQSHRPSILSLVAAADLQSSKISLDADFSSVTTKNLKDAAGLSATPRSDMLLRSNGQRSELQLIHRKSKASAVIPQQQGAACRLEPDSPAAFILSASQVQQATPPPGTLSLNAGLKVDRHTTRLPSGSTAVNPFPSFLLSPAAEQTLPARVEESQLEVGKPSAAEKPAEGALTQRCLGQVRLKELPTWLASRTPSRPRDVAHLAQSGWRWYYRRYIDVKKGGVAGLSMLLVGYCVLSYIWSYPHIKLSRWRKYH